MASAYTPDQVTAIRRGIQAALNMVVNADPKGSFGETVHFTKALQAALPQHLWKVYLGKLEGVPVVEPEYDAAIRTAFGTLDQVSTADGYVMRFSLIYALQQAAGFKNGITPNEKAAIDRIMWLVGPPVHAYAPPGYIPPPIVN